MKRKMTLNPEKLTISTTQPRYTLPKHLFFIKTTTNLGFHELLMHVDMLVKLLC